MHLQAQGELQRTDQSLDLALDGDGLLLIRDKSGAPGGARTGAFHLTKEGRLQDAKGLTLQGWPLLPEGAGSTASATGSTTGVGSGVSTPGGTPFGSAFTESDASAGTAGAETTKSGSIPAGSVATQAPPPSAAFIGPLGALEDIQLIKPEPAPPPEVPAPPPIEEPAPLPEDPPPFYGTGLTMHKEADGLYSLHSSAVYQGGPDGLDLEETTIQCTLVDSLGQEHVVTLNVQQRPDYLRIMLTSADINTGNQTLLWYNFENSEGTCDGCTFDETTKQVVFALEGTGAELRLDLSDTQTAATRGDKLTFTAEEPWFWRFPPMIFEEGTFKIKQDQEADLYIDGSYVTWVYGTFEVRRNESGSLVGLWKRNTNLSVEVTFNEEGQVSGYKFLKNANSTSDPSVGIEHTGSLVEGAYCAGLGFFNIDLSAVQVIDKTKPAPPKEELLPEEIKEEIPAEPLEEEVPEETKARFAPLSPASLSIDENGVLKRLKDNGDWEPIYLLACGQFAAMNSAEERNGVYYATPASGVLRTGVSGKDGMGTITAGTLERSTTDLAHELSDMIRAQHAYAANTKVLSTLDDMLTELERL